MSSLVAVAEAIGTRPTKAVELNTIVLWLAHWKKVLRSVGKMRKNTADSPAVYPLTFAFFISDFLL